MCAEGVDFAEADKEITRGVADFFLMAGRLAFFLIKSLDSNERAGDEIFVLSECSRGV
jgi:hypothetical protein